MEYVRLDEEHITGLDRMKLTAVFDAGFAFEDDDLMLVVVLMPRCVAARLDGEMAHGEVRRAISTADHQAHRHALHAVHLHRLTFHILCASNQHGFIIDRAGRYTIRAMDDLNALALPELFERLVCGRLLDALLELAIEEDAAKVGPGDITSDSIIAAERAAQAQLVSREQGVVAGLALVPLVLERLDEQCRFDARGRDGEACSSREVLGVIHGPLLAILRAERIILNLIGRLSGVATLTKQYVDAVAGTGAVICETRKTTPGLRRLEKYAARCGGATLHRIALDDAALFKDNHLAHVPEDQLTQVLSDAAKHIRARHDVRFIEVEVDTLEQLDRVLAIEPGLIDFVLLDNMPRDVLTQAVRMRDERSAAVAATNRIALEASGGITLANVRAIAETGVDRISVGAITHSAASLDVGLDIVCR